MAKRGWEVSISCACDLETFNPYIERHHRARKAHTCDDCGGTIHPGERYLHHGGKFDGEWSMYNRCPDCQHMIHEVGRTLMAHCGGWWCIYCGDLPLSWDDLWEYQNPISDDEAGDVRRIVAMQHAVCEGRNGTRKWSMPDCALYVTCSECGEDVPRETGDCAECGWRRPARRGEG